jgi:hypothetical protein
MNWPVTAGIAQLVLIVFFLVTQLRLRRRPVGELLLYAIPMAALAVGTLLGADWAIVVAAVFYSIWLINHVLSWRRPSRAEHIRPDPSTRAVALPPAVRVALGVVSLAVLALTWCAVVASSVHPVA